ncbi:FkbM family methyltransferase, partial [bacterium]|nr:FkbM family methyltransferase [bacterium]
FIKMDIEGGELSALRGAKKLITTHLPRLAICVYHRPDDFWAVPELILGWGCQYDLFLRHYTESIYETVMYFIPKKGQTTSPTP